jgi:glyoxylase-like metal-dependent hydrolase (beta-lactamase superfamily II)
MDRRQFLASSSTAATALLLSPYRFWHLGLSGTFIELRRGVGTYTNSGGTIGWLVRPEGVVVVDSQFRQQATEFAADLKSRSQRRIDVLMNTHHHRDHTMGNSVLIPLAEASVAHENSRVWQEKAAVERRIESEQVYPATTFADQWSSDIGDEVVRASYHGPAHTSGDAVILFERAAVVHMGDLVFNRYPCFIDRDSGASIVGWIKLLEKTHEQFSESTLFVFGHGGPAYGITGGRADLLVMRDFLTGLLEFAGKGIAEGRTEDQVAETTRLPDFPDHYSESWSNGVSNALRKAYQELSAD